MGAPGRALSPMDAPDLARLRSGARWNDSIGSVVLAVSSSSRASLFARSGSQPWASTLGLSLARASLSPRLEKESATPSLPSQLNRWPSQRFNWIGRAGCVFFRKSFVVRSLRAYNRPAPRSRLVLRKNPPRHHFPPNGIVQGWQERFESLRIRARGPPWEPS